MLYIDTCLFINITHGGFIPINCSNQFKNIYILNNDNDNDNDNNHNNDNMIDID